MEQDFTQQINEVNDLIKKELESWDLLKMDPGKIEFNDFIMDAYINSLASFLVEKGIIEDQEFTLFFKSRLLSNLTNARMRFAPEVMEARKKMSTAIATPNKGIILPNGNIKPIN